MLASDPLIFLGVALLLAGVLLSKTSSRFDVPSLLLLLLLGMLGGSEAISARVRRLRPGSALRRRGRGVHSLQRRRRHGLARHSPRSGARRGPGHRGCPAQRRRARLTRRADSRRAAARRHAARVDHRLHRRGGCLLAAAVARRGHRSTAADCATSPSPNGRQRSARAS